MRCRAIDLWLFVLEIARSVRVVPGTRYRYTNLNFVTGTDVQTDRRRESMTIRNAACYWDAWIPYKLTVLVRQVFVKFSGHFCNRLIRGRPKQASAISSDAGRSLFAAVNCERAMCCICVRSRADDHYVTVCQSCWPIWIMERHRQACSQNELHMWQWRSIYKLVHTLIPARLFNLCTQRVCKMQLVKAKLFT